MSETAFRKQVVYNMYMYFIDQNSLGCAAAIHVHAFHIYVDVKQEYVLSIQVHLRRLCCVYQC